MASKSKEIKPTGDSNSKLTEKEKTPAPLDPGPRAKKTNQHDEVMRAEAQATSQEVSKVAGELLSGKLPDTETLTAAIDKTDELLTQEVKKNKAISQDAKLKQAVKDTHVYLEATKKLLESKTGDGQIQQFIQGAFSASTDIARTVGGKTAADDATSQMQANFNQIVHHARKVLVELSSSAEFRDFVTRLADIISRLIGSDVDFGVKRNVYPPKSARKVTEEAKQVAVDQAGETLAKQAMLKAQVHSELKEKTHAEPSFEESRESLPAEEARMDLIQQAALKVKAQAELLERTTTKQEAPDVVGTVFAQRMHDATLDHSQQAALKVKTQNELKEYFNGPEPEHKDTDIAPEQARYKAQANAELLRAFAEASDLEDSDDYYDDEEVTVDMALERFRNLSLPEGYDPNPSPASSSSSIPVQSITMSPSGNVTTSTTAGGRTVVTGQFKQPSELFDSSKLTQSDKEEHSLESDRRKREEDKEHSSHKHKSDKSKDEKHSHHHKTEETKEKDEKEHRHSHKHKTEDKEEKHSHRHKTEETEEKDVKEHRHSHKHKTEEKEEKHSHGSKTDEKKHHHEHKSKASQSAVLSDVERAWMDNTDKEERRALQKDLVALLNKMSAQPGHKEAIESLFTLADLLWKSVPDHEQEAMVPQSLQQVAQDGKEALGAFTGGVKNIDKLINYVQKFAAKVRNDKDVKRVLHKFRSYIRRTLEDPQLLKQKHFRQKFYKLLDRAGYIGENYADDKDLRGVLRAWRRITNSITKDKDINEFGAALNKLRDDITYVDRSGVRRMDMQTIDKLRQVLMPVFLEQLHYVPIPAVNGSDKDMDYSLEELVVSFYDLLPEHIFIDTETHTDFKPLSDEDHVFVDRTLQEKMKAEPTNKKRPYDRHHAWGYFNDRKGKNKNRPKESIAPGTTSDIKNSTTGGSVALAPDSHLRSTAQLVIRAYNIQFDIKDMKFDMNRKTFPKIHAKGLADVSTVGSKGCKVVIRLDMLMDADQPRPFTGAAVEVKIAPLKMRIHGSKHDAFYKAMTQLYASTIRKRVQEMVVKQLESKVQFILDSMNTLFSSTVGQVFNNPTKFVKLEHLAGAAQPVQAQHA